MPRVLVVEDDAAVRQALSRALVHGGYAVDAVGTAMAGLQQIMSNPPALVLLDLGLPDLDGSDALVMVRAVSDVPVIVITARRDEANAIRLLNVGADDYLTKPFSAAHVLARVGAVLRRTGTHREKADGRVLTVGPLRLDRDTRTATLHGADIRLTRKEYDLLFYLAERAGRVVTREELFTAVWRQPFVRADQTIDSHVSLVRRKLGESAAEPRLLRTVRGVGMMLTES